MAFAPDKKNPGDLIKSTDWNDALAEVVRLEGVKLDKAGGAVTGPLSIAGALAIGNTAPDRALTVQGAAGTYLNVKGDAGAHEILVGADSNGGVVSTMTNHDLQLRAGANVTRLTIKADGKVGIGTLTPGFLLDVVDRCRIRQGPAPSAGLWFFQNTPNNDRAFVGMADDNSVGFWGNTGANWGLRMDITNASLTLTGDLSIPKTAGGSATFSHSTFANENILQPNNLKLIMGSTGLIFAGGPGLVYDFAIGHTFFNFILGGGASTTFTRVFSVNHLGNMVISGSLSAGGGKGGYVTDHFINAAGDAVEQGDLVVLGVRGADRYYGANSNIPVPEVDPSTEEYDTRVCGVVDSVVDEGSLPPADIKPLTREEAEAGVAPREHPLTGLAVPATPETNAAKVGPNQLGRMVTLGAYAHCKVDADIAPIEVGDLLTTSPTKGHAQKVTDPSRAVGCIVGKALAPLSSGKGKIPIIVLLQ